MSELTLAQKDKLLADLRVVIADAEEVLRVTAGQAGEGFGELRARMQDRVQQAKSGIVQLQHTAIAKARAAGHATDEFVHESPWRAIGISAGLGLMIGLLIGRR
jgi:ElaB/YqjD/DUF883 family membrane-anchored ribosome-binding protein